MHMTQEDFSLALQKNYSIFLKAFHWYLYQQYENSKVCREEKNALTIADLDKLKSLEFYWIKPEKRKCFHHYNCHQNLQSVHTLITAIEKHPIGKHRYINHLSAEASKAEIIEFLKNESFHYLELDQQLASLLVGLSTPLKPIMISYLWQKSGKGEAVKSQEMLYLTLLETIGSAFDRDKIVEQMCWENLAVINLIQYFSKYSFNKIKYLGLLAATELLKLLEFEKIIFGLHRVLGKRGMSPVFKNQIEANVRSNTLTWLNEVITTEFSIPSDERREFWIGFYMCLNARERFYEKCLNNNTMLKVANFI